MEMYNFEQAFSTSHINSWYVEVCQHLDQRTMPSHFYMWYKRALSLKELSYHLVHGVIYRKNHNGIFSCASRHMIQKRFYVISMMEKSGEFSQETQKFTILCMSISTGLHYSKINMLMLIGVQSIRDALTKIKGQ